MAKRNARSKFESLGEFLLGESSKMEELAAAEKRGDLSSGSSQQVKLTLKKPTTQKCTENEGTEGKEGGLSYKVVSPHARKAAFIVVQDRNTSGNSNNKVRTPL